MPNPKIGSVLPPNANIKPLYEKLRMTVNLVTKNEPTIKCSVGKEDMDDRVIDNILTVYNSIIQKLPNEKQNIKSVLLKLTMGPAFIIGKEEEKEDKKKDKKGKIKSKEKEAKEKPKEEIKKEAKQEKKVPEKEKPMTKKTTTQNWSIIINNIKIKLNDKIVNKKLSNKIGKIIILKNN